MQHDAGEYCVCVRVYVCVCVYNVYNLKRCSTGEHATWAAWTEDPPLSRRKSAVAPRPPSSAPATQSFARIFLQKFVAESCAMEGSKGERCDDEKKPIYLDYNATTPLDPAVSSAMLPYLQGRFGNPSSGHWYGVKEKEAVETARARVAALLGAADPSEIIFTSGGTESVNWAIKATAERFKTTHKHIITSKVEHVVVLECCKYLQEVHGFEVTYLPVDETGRVNPESLRTALRDDTCLVSIMHANNETGSINDITALATIAHERGVLFHTDASQSVGKVTVDLAQSPVDFLTVAGHKLYCPAGVGALFVRRGCTLGKWMHGAGHEAGRRAGTENTMHLVALGEACLQCQEHAQEHESHLKRMRDLLHSLLLAKLPGLRLNGPVEGPHTQKIIGEKFVYNINC